MKRSDILLNGTRASPLASMANTNITEGGKAMKRYLVRDDIAPSCYFRSLIKSPYRKAMIQITERCNHHCAHCFLNADSKGDDIEVRSISKVIVPVLRRCKVASVTLTGGEPFLHPGIIEIVKILREKDIQVGICSNVTVITEEQVKALSRIGGVHVNASLDGFRPESHGKFRGNKTVFERAIKNISLLGKYSLLQGILSTPNILAKPNEYAQICNFAIQNRAIYVLMNPIGRMGRGIEAINKLSVSREVLSEIRKITTPFSNKIQVVYIRFPNSKLPLSRCEVGNLFYVFVHGEVTVCPYLVFAGKNLDSKYEPEEFIVGNIFDDINIETKLEKYRFHQRYHLGENNPLCRNCRLEINCGRGCPAAIIASGEKLEGNIDKEMCLIGFKNGPDG